MKIGIFTETYTPYISGVVTSISMLKKGLNELGHEVYVFTFNLVSKDEYETDHIIYFDGFNIPIKALENFKLSAVHRKKLKIVEQYDLDIIHIHTEFSMGKLGVICGKKLNIPIVYTFHTLYEDYLPYFSRFLDKHCHKMLMRTLRRIIHPITATSLIKIVPTTKVLNFTSKYGIEGDIRVVPSGIDLEPFSAPLSYAELVSLREENGLDKDEFVFSSVGRVSKEKSLDKVVRAFAKFSKTAKAKLLIVGDGPYHENIKKLVDKLGIASKVIFVGFVKWDEISKYYKIGNIIVNASITETQGLTNIEALASGRPLLVQKDECLADVVVNNYNGIYFDGIDDLVEKMHYCISHKEIFKDMEKNCINSVEKYSKLCYANSALEIYKEAIEKYKVL